MGGGSSKPRPQSEKSPLKPIVTPKKAIGRHHSLNSIGTFASNKRKRVHELNDASIPLTKSSNDIEIHHAHVEKDLETIHLLTATLTKVLLLDERSSQYESIVEKLLDLVQHDALGKNELICTVGEVPPSKLFIIDHGQIETKDSDENILILDRGKYLGELCMMFDTPSKVTAFTLTGVTAWTLWRSDLQRIQRQTSADSNLHELFRLKNVKELSYALPSSKMTILVHDLLRKKTFAASETIFDTDSLVSSVYLIESGSIMLKLPQKFLDMGISEMLIKLGICIPSQDDDNGDNGQASSQSHNQREGVYKLQGDVITLGEGCVLGIGVLRGRGQLSHGWDWSNEASTGAKSPITVQAVTAVACSHFTISQFEATFGRLVDLLGRLRAEEEEMGSLAIREKELDEVKWIELHGNLHFSEGSFKKIQVFSEIPMGVVALAYGHTDTRGSTKSGDEKFALKIINKTAVTAQHQRKHVLQESSILGKLNCPFISKMWGRFQTPSDLVFVLEWLPGGDLYHLIHEHSSYSAQPGLPVDFVRFYGANILSALGYMRGLEVAYRNLKPENVMFASNGYAKLVGFGISKIIPYKATHRKAGSSGFLYKTHTLCGSLEYMAPEMITHKGHDQTVDNWAFGVLLFEMLTGCTPFHGKDDSEVMTKIASVLTQADVIPFAAYPTVFNDSSFGDAARRVISGLMEPRFTDRWSIHTNDMEGVFGSAFFQSGNLDWEALRNQTVSAPYQPTNIQDSEMMLHADAVMFEGMPQSPAFEGDQSLFESF